VPKRSHNTIEKILSYNFNDKSILKLALTHSSIRSNPNNYERLEFFGDSIIDFIVSEWLLLKKEKLDQGELTTIKSTFISRKNLSLLGREMNLINYAIIHKSVDLSSNSTIDRINSDLYESIVGAIYLDSNYQTVKDFVYNTLLKHNSLDQENYKGKLNELCHQQKIAEPSYSLISGSGPDHNKKYKVKVLVKDKIFFGYSTKIKQAEINAAKKALIDLFSF
tara:strand:- start:547 stop:1212 length:666 start_codon:yes stop_codon:yes gene_type:complete